MKSYQYGANDSTFLGNIAVAFPCDLLPKPMQIVNESGGVPGIETASDSPTVDPGANIPDGVYIPASQTSTETSTATGQTCNVCTSMTTMNNNAAATVDGVKGLLPIAKNIDENLQKSVNNDSAISKQLSDVNTNLGKLTDAFTGGTDTSMGIGAKIDGIGPKIANSIDGKFNEETGLINGNEVIAIKETDFTEQYLFGLNDKNQIKSNIDSDLQSYKVDIQSKTDILTQKITNKISIVAGGSCSVSIPVWGHSIVIDFCPYESHVKSLGVVMLGITYLSSVIIILRS
jgi:hypothetical protein